MKIAMKQVPKIFLIGLALLAGTGIFAGSVFAANSNDQSSMLQQRLITGTVTSAEDGSPMVGVTVIVKGTTIGTITNEKGEYSLDVPSSAQTLVFSFVGMKTQEVAIGTSNAIDVVMKVEATAMDEVVVTALGMTRQKKALGYAVAEVSGEDLERTKENNFMNTLAGKVAGVSITRNASGVSGSSRVVIRGNSSLSGNCQPLYVIDGVPIDNTQYGEAGRWGGIDQGDGLGMINPADIESLTVLKGANASALYGSRAANGVIIITTKKGKARKGLGVNLTQTYTWDTPLVFPQMQNTYGQGSGGTLPVGTDGIPYTSKDVDGSYGPKMEGQDVRDWTGTVQKFSPQPNNIKDFYQTGHTSTTTVAFTGGSEKINSRLSYTYDDIAGIQPTNNVKRHTIYLRTTAKLSDKLTADSKISYVNYQVTNRPQMSDLQGNPAYNLSVMPRSLRTADLKNFITSDYQENIWTSDTYKGNPYWTINREHTGDNVGRLQGFASLQYDFTKWLNLMVRAAEDRTDRYYVYYRAKGTHVRPIGDMSQYKFTTNELNTDFLLTAKKENGQVFNGFVSVGGNVWDRKYEYMYDGGSQFKIIEFYKVSNLVNYSTSWYSDHKQIRSLYGMGQISFHNYAFLDVTARNDWSSALPKGNNSYFYPSASLSFVASDAFADFFNSQKIVSFAKLRASWAQVGNDVSPYSTLVYYNFNSDSYNVTYNGVTYANPTGSVSNSAIPCMTLKPEITTSTEFGTDLRFLNNRIGIDFTYYDKSTKNQILTATISRASGSLTRVMNAGRVTNKGVELLLTLTPVKTNDFSWDVTFNFAKNKSKVVSLMEGISTYSLGADRLISVECRPGQPYGNLYAAQWLRDSKGNRMVDSTGVGLVKGTTSTYGLVGNFNPDWTGGIGNTITYKGISLYFLVDIRSGGEFLSLSKYYMGAYGTSKESLEGRETWYASEAARVDAGKTSDEWVPTGGYRINGVVAKWDAASGTWVSTGEKNTRYINPENRYRGVGEEYIEDGSFVKMREISLGYEIPKKLLSRTPIQSASVAFVGRNLFFFYKACKNFDPEVSYNSTNYGAGVESHAMPTSKNIGFSVKINF